MPLTYTCTGVDPIEARRVLGEVVAEMRRRADVCAATGHVEWTGGKLHLEVDEAHRLDGDGLELLAHVLRVGRKVGVTGVVRGPSILGRPWGVDTPAGDMLAAGVPLRFEATSVVGPNLAGSHHPATIATG
jgi:GNAT superfamily N-acetyltransferase